MGVFRYTLCFIACFLSQTDCPAEDLVGYAKDVKPLLKARCYACHGSLKQEAGLRLDTGAYIRRGGDSGTGVMPGLPDSSLLIARVTAEDENSRMPPEGEPLSDEEIAMLKNWIASGAASPIDEAAEADPSEHWAFQPMKRPRVDIKQHDDAGLPKNPIDTFVERKLAENELTVLPLATKEVLLRRVYLDLIGLPPTRKELLEFVGDTSVQVGSAEFEMAWEQVVDRLLADPRHGERWARHWMDIWRYSDWYGRRHVPDVWNSAPQIWRWRDWIVDSLNDNKGYDRMLQEMLAADEICPDDSRNAVATGYLIRNWYALNPNDWMRNIVEHTGKAFLGLTFNCAHCHDHKYDPIRHEDYFRLRAFFEPIYVRQDQVPGEADPGPFEDYNYSTLRRVQHLGAVRVFDKNPEAATWFYHGGDERNRDQEKGSIPPGVPEFLSKGLPPIEPVQLPPSAWYPGLDSELQETVRKFAQDNIIAARTQVEVAKSIPKAVPQAARDRLANLKAAYNKAQNAAGQAGRLKPLVGKQSLMFDASSGRRVLQNRLPGLKELLTGFSIEFQVLLIHDTHFNFQLAKHIEKGLTAGYVAFEQGRIISYQPGTFTTFDAGIYRLSEGQNRFHVRLVLHPENDHCLLTVRSLSDNALLVDAAPVALNGWNPVNDMTKGISFDAHSGSIAAIDEVILKSALDSGANQTSILDDAQHFAHYDFEQPIYQHGLDVVGLGSWEESGFSIAPATSVVTEALTDPTLNDLKQQLATAKRSVEIDDLKLQAAEYRLRAMQAELESLEARIAADRARYGESPNTDPAALATAASQAERTAKRLGLEADVSLRESELAIAESKSEDNVERTQAIATANQNLQAAQTLLAKARSESKISESELYTALSPTYPHTSTGRRCALAQWITHPENPLPARVAVNHIWSWHFHAPLVSSLYDFGRNGDSPTHPELLDWLAVEFVESGWNMKHLHRLIVTSNTYRRRSNSFPLLLISTDQSHDEATRRDLENQLLWRMNSGRMEAEVIRDSLLMIGGLLDTTMGGRPLETQKALTTNRRSLYYEIYPEDGGVNAFAALFDAPSPLDCYRRTRSIVPQQALALTNSELIHRVSQAVVNEWATRSQSDQPDETFVEEMFQRILNRSPSGAELNLCLKSLQVQRQLSGQVAPSQQDMRARESLVRALLNHNDFVTIR